jgi:hypothetical protein
MNLMLPFASKELPNGKKLYRRKKGYQVALDANTTTVYEIIAPYSAQKINKVEILYCAVDGLTCDFKILDTSTGTYSTTPDYVLNQFGWSVNIAQGYYEDVSEYDADLYQGMRIQLTFNNPGAEQSLGINIIFHEVKDS